MSTPIKVNGIMQMFRVKSALLKKDDGTRIKHYRFLLCAAAEVCIRKGVEYT